MPVRNVQPRSLLPEERNIRQRLARGGVCFAPVQAEPMNS